VRPKVDSGALRGGKRRRDVSLVVWSHSSLVVARWRVRHVTVWPLYNYFLASNVVGLIKFADAC